MRKRYVIQVRQKADYLEPGPVLATIKRTLTGRCIGNFNPIYCRYKGEWKLVRSLDGDLSDPFRRTEEYAKTLFIEV